MKRISLLIILMTLLIVISGCSTTKNDELTIVPDPKAEELEAEGMGHYADIIQGDRIVGVQYYTAPSEMSVTANYSQDIITLQVTINTPDRIPFSEFEALTAGTYEIMDESGSVLDFEGTAEAGKVANGEATITISPANPEALKPGNYILRITSLISEKKADQPLEVFGNWDTAFTK